MSPYPGYLTKFLFCLFAVIQVAGSLVADEPPPEKSALPKPQPTESVATPPGLLSVLGGSLRDEVVVVAPGLTCPTDEKNADATRPTVILVPGLLAHADSMSTIKTAVSKASFCVGTFGYSSHLGIQKAAQQLSKELKALKVAAPKRQLVMVTHSMGGLVVRECLETPSLNPGNVVQLIMIAPPNHGSSVAGFTATELANTLGISLPVAQAGLNLVDDLLVGFVGVAKDDLKPQSPTMKTLASRPRAAGVKYTIIAGTAGPVRADLVEASMLIGQLAFRNQTEIQDSMDRIGQLARLDEWSRGRGDGVVSVKSAKLEGVTDFVTLPFSHNAFGKPVTPTAQMVIDEVIQRLPSP